MDYEHALPPGFQATCSRSGRRMEARSYSVLRAMECITRIEKAVRERDRKICCTSRTNRSGRTTGPRTDTHLRSGEPKNKERSLGFAPLRRAKTISFCRDGI